MIKQIFVYIIFLLMLACNNSNKPDTTETTEQAPVTTLDSTVSRPRIIKADITKIIPGSEQIRKAYSYFIINGNDTSSFRCHFSEWKADSTLFFVAKFSKTMTYMKQRDELVQILAEARHDFNLKMLNTIGIGRLMTTGDLAVRVTSQFAAIQYKEELNAFLLHSALADDFNTLLNPYGIKLKQVVTEKQEYTPRKELSKLSVIETPQKDIPEEIVDCVVYLKLERM